MEEQLWIIFNIAEFDGTGTACIVTESKVRQYLESEADGIAGLTEEEGSDEPVECAIDAAMETFKNFADAGWAVNYSETVMLGSNTYHFQRLCGGSVYSAYLPDFMPLINLLDIAEQ